jgi:hypothetical protein
MGHVIPGSGHFTAQVGNVSHQRHQRVADLWRQFGFGNSKNFNGVRNGAGGAGLDRWCSNWA